MQINTFDIIMEMLMMLPLVWLVLFLCRKRLFPNGLPKEERLKKPVTTLIIPAMVIRIVGGQQSDLLINANNLWVTLFLILLSQTSSFLMILGCGNLSYKKGYHWGWGFMGTFSLLGLLVIVLFKKKV